jgi:hypothetical protein
VTATDHTDAGRGGQVAIGAASPVVVPGLTNGDTYTFTVTATNAIGTGPASLATPAATPKGPQSVQFTTTAPSGERVGSAPYVPGAHASSGLPVAITLDASSRGCVLVNGAVAFRAAGTCVLDANQAGDSTYDAASTVQQEITIGRGLNAITITSAPSTATRAVGRSYRPIASATSRDRVTVRVGASSRSCTISRGLVSFVRIGICVLEFTDPGNANYLAAAERTQRFVVAKGTVSIHAIASPWTSKSSRSEVLHARLSSRLATGTVRFAFGTLLLCTATIHQGVASCRVTKKLPEGGYPVKVTYSGSAEFHPATGATGFVVT